MKPKPLRQKPIFTERKLLQFTRTSQFLSRKRQPEPNPTKPSHTMRPHNTPTTEAIEKRARYQLAMPADRASRDAPDFDHTVLPRSRNGSAIDAGRERDDGAGRPLNLAAPVHLQHLVGGGRGGGSLSCSQARMVLTPPRDHSRCVIVEACDCGLRKRCRMEAGHERGREGGREGGAVVERNQRKTKWRKHWSCATTPNTGAGLLLRSWMNEVRAPHEIAKGMDGCIWTLPVGRDESACSSGPVYTMDHEVGSFMCNACTK